MRRFFINPSQVGERHIAISDPSDYRHISKVLRLAPGDLVSISDGVRWEYSCRLEEFKDGQEVLFVIEDRQAIAGQSANEIILFQGVPKSSKIETVIQKSVELGVSRIVPVFMKRTIVQGIDKYNKKNQRFNQIALEASKQSRRPLPAQVDPAIDFSQALLQLESCNLVIFPYEEEDGYTIKSQLRQARQDGIIKDGIKIGLIIGPEGGFSDNEAKALIDKGYRPVCIARTILRTETAGPAVLAMLNYELEL